MKRQIDIEKLLHWAYRDELSKRATSSAEGLWDHIHESGQLGGIRDDGRRGDGGAQRYDFGTIHQDAIRIEAAVGALEDTVIDWASSFDAIAAELSGLVSVNEAKASAHPWCRDVLLVNSHRTKVLVTTHAIRGSRPEWYDEPPQPNRILADKGKGPKIVGECKGRNLYTAGSYCPLRWEPSPLSIVMARAEYAAWYAGMSQLAARLDLVDHIALAPAAAPTPWLDAPVSKPEPVVIRPSVRMQALPLAPQRSAPIPSRRPQNSPVRYPLAS